MLYILAILVIVFMLQLAIPGFTSLFILDPSKPLEIWRIVTSIFLHANISHLFFNSISIFFFAPVLERLLGKKELYKIFLLGGIVGSILYLLLVYIGISPSIPALGASGAVYAILGAVAFFNPEGVVYLYFFPMKLKHAVILWIIINLLYTFDWTSGIGGAAHLGGLAFGWLYAKYLSHQYSSWNYY
ncbi:rhomboid family intramembrane serine protease [Candidatus Micrarchaeota archaeon]|nr:rhomboid family intramembrane serine protease [Candidatus Micrarchaeota archaeon]